jgi:hypothetical protein
MNENRIKMTIPGSIMVHSHIVKGLKLVNPTCQIMSTALVMLYLSAASVNLVSHN